MEKKTLLKICGIRSIEEIKELKKMNIDFFGCIFAKSPREVSVELAREITETAHRNGKKAVGVFVNKMIEKVIGIVLETGIDRIQLHGDESPEYCSELFKKIDKLNKKYRKDVKIWKVFSVMDEMPDIEDYLPFIEYPLFDTKGEKQGGNGVVFDWKILEELEGQPFILAGGLSLENIREAMKYSPVILDVNSRVEIDNRKNKRLIEKVIFNITDFNVSM